MRWLLWTNGAYNQQKKGGAQPLGAPWTPRPGGTESSIAMTSKTPQNPIWLVVTATMEFYDFPYIGNI